MFKSNNDHNNLSDQFLAEIKKSLNKEESPYFEKENQLHKILAKQDDESKLTFIQPNDEINETKSEKDEFKISNTASEEGEFGTNKIEKDPYHFSEQLKLEEKTSLPKEPNKIVQQCSDHIIKSIKRNNNFISFTLEPKELGKIGIKMDFEHKNILITTDQQEMLQENLDMLSSNLNDSGMGNMNFNFERKENPTNQESLESELPPPENSDCLLDILV